MKLAFHFRQPLWIVPLAIAGFVAVFGWWGDGRLRQTIEQELKADLTAALDANVTALEIWTTNQAKLATALAEEPEVQSLAVRVLDSFNRAGGDGKNWSDVPEVEELATYLRPRLNKVGYGMAHLVSTNLMVVAGSMRGRFRSVMPVYEEHVAKFSELFASGQPIIITPFKPKRPPEAGIRGGPRRTREDASRPPDGAIPGRGPGTNDLPGPERLAPPDPSRFRRGDFTLMQVAAPVRDSNSIVRGALALIIDPDAEFT